MDMVVAVTGRNEKTLKSWGIDYLTCHVHFQLACHLLSGGQPDDDKLIFSKDEGKVLGLGSRF